MEKQDSCQAEWLELKSRAHIMNHKQESERMNWEWHVTLKSQSPLPVRYSSKATPSKLAKWDYQPGLKYTDACNYGVHFIQTTTMIYQENFTKDMPKGPVC